MVRIVGNLWILGSAAAVAVFWILVMLGLPAVFFVFAFSPFPFLLAVYRVGNYIPSLKTIGNDVRVTAAALMMIAASIMSFFFGPIAVAVAAVAGACFYILPWTYRRVRPARTESADEPPVESPV